VEVVVLTNSCLRYDPKEDETERIAMQLFEQQEFKNNAKGSWKDACNKTKREYRRRAWNQRMATGS
jgi:hypothetical protein